MNNEYFVLQSGCLHKLMNLETFTVFFLHHPDVNLLYSSFTEKRQSTTMVKEQSDNG